MELGSANRLGSPAEQTRAWRDQEMFKYDLYYFIALRTQVNLPNSILFSISPKWAWTIPAFPSCCKEFITMHKQSTYYSACKLAVCVQEMRAVITDNKVMVFLVTDCCSGSRTYYQSLKKSLFFFCHMYRFLAISCG